MNKLSNLNFSNKILKKQYTTETLVSKNYEEFPNTYMLFPNFSLTNSQLYNSEESKTISISLSINISYKLNHFFNLLKGIIIVFFFLSGFFILFKILKYLFISYFFYYKTNFLKKLMLHKWVGLQKVTYCSNTVTPYKSDGNSHDEESSTSRKWWEWNNPGNLDFFTSSGCFTVTVVNIVRDFKTYVAAHSTPLNKEQFELTIKFLNDFGLYDFVDENDENEKDPTVIQRFRHADQIAYINFSSLRVAARIGNPSGQEVQEWPFTVKEDDMKEFADDVIKEAQKILLNETPTVPEIQSSVYPLINLLLDYSSESYRSDLFSEKTINYIICNIVKYVDNASIEEESSKPDYYEEEINNENSKKQKVN